MNLDYIRKGIEDQGYIVTNIWNIKEHDISYSEFYVELKSENNNKDIYELTSFFQNLNHHTQNMKFFNAIIASSMATQKVFTSIKQDKSSRRLLNI